MFHQTCFGGVRVYFVHFTTELQDAYFLLYIGETIKDILLLSRAPLCQPSSVTQLRCGHAHSADLAHGWWGVYWEVDSFLSP